jgi:hypothetical protein
MRSAGAARSAGFEPIEEEAEFYRLGATDGAARGKRFHA